MKWKFWKKEVPKPLFYRTTRITLSAFQLDVVFISGRGQIAAADVEAVAHMVEAAAIGHLGEWAQMPTCWFYEEVP